MSRGKRPLLIPELKWFDTEILAAGTDSTWTVEEDATVKCLSAVSQGSGDSQRDGRQYHISSIQLRGEMSTSAIENQSNTKSTKHCRIVLVLDTQTNKAQMTATDVFEDTFTNRFNFRNLLQEKRFKVLRDIEFIMWTYTINEGQQNKFASPTSHRLWNMEFNFPVPLEVNCTGTGGTIANILDNSLHIIAVATGGLITYTSRIRFIG